MEETSYEHSWEDRIHKERDEARQDLEILTRRLKLYEQWAKVTKADCRTCMAIHYGMEAEHHLPLWWEKEMDELKARVAELERELNSTLPEWHTDPDLVFERLRKAEARVAELEAELAAPVGERVAKLTIAVKSRNQDISRLQERVTELEVGVETWRQRAHNSRMLNLASCFRDLEQAQERIRTLEARLAEREATNREDLHRLIDIVCIDLELTAGFWPGWLSTPWRDRLIDKMLSGHVPSDADRQPLPAGPAGPEVAGV